MLEFYIAGQSMKMYSPVIAADSLNYLTARFNFTGSEWEGYTRWAHFRKGETVYDIALDENNTITEDKALNLTIGEWEIYVTGAQSSSRLTTVVVIVTVKASGLIDAPLHVIPMSVAEQVDSKASQALLLAQAVKDAADAGKFNGKGFTIKGIYTSVDELQSSVSEPDAGDMYGVGEAEPYDVYVWDGHGRAWVNLGPVRGVAGETGAAGTTFTPYVDANGNISWTNDGGKENPETRNIRGPKGDTGAAGAAGKSPYAAAVEAGYTGTEATFYAALTAMPYHNARHLPDGADPITVKAGNIDESAVETAKIKNAAVTADKIAAGAVTAELTGTLTAAGWANDTSGGYLQTIAVAGLLASDTLAEIDINPGEASAAQIMAWDDAWSFVTGWVGAGQAAILFRDKPDIDVPVRIRVWRK